MYENKAVNAEPDSTCIAFSGSKLDVFPEVACEII